MLAIHNVQLVMMLNLVNLVNLGTNQLMEIAYVREKILSQVLAKIKPYFQLVLLFVLINLPLSVHRTIPGTLNIH